MIFDLKDHVDTIDKSVSSSIIIIIGTNAESATA